MATYSGLKSKDELASLDNLLASLICSWNLSKEEKDIIFATQLKLFSIRTISLPKIIHL
jgi:hypothetical protein